MVAPTHRSGAPLIAKWSLTKLKSPLAQPSMKSQPSNQDDAFRKLVLNARGGDSKSVFGLLLLVDSTVPWRR